MHNQKIAYSELVQLYTDNNRLIEAYSYALKALKIDPNYQGVNYGLSYGVRYAGLLEESIAFIKKDNQIEPDPYNVARNLSNIARAYFYMGDVELGRKKFDDVLKYIQDEGIETSSYLLFYDGLAHLYSGNTDKAIKKFDECNTLDPAQIFSKYGQIYKYIFLNQRSRAIDLINELEKMTVNDGEQYYRQIHFYSLLDMPNKAINKNTTKKTTPKLRLELILTSLI